MSFDEDRRREIENVLKEDLFTEEKVNKILASEKEILKSICLRYIDDIAGIDEFYNKYDLNPSWKEELEKKFWESEHRIDGCLTNIEIVEEELLKFAEEVNERATVDGWVYTFMKKLLSEKGIK